MTCLGAFLELGLAVFIGQFLVRHRAGEGIAYVGGHVALIFGGCDLPT